MIDIKDKSKCCGCEACSQICPKSCISMIPDEEGFLYPFVDVKECINCGLCKKTCPVNNPTTLSSPKIEVFAAKNPSLTIRQSSSSGGFFSCVAENIVNDEGCVCGAAFDDNYDTPVIVGKKVAVVGGGNVAMDAVRTALRLGADASIVYRRSEEELPARVEEVHHAKEEGVKFELLTNPTEILTDDKGNVTGMKCIRMELGEPDASGRRSPVEIPNSEFVMDVDMVIMSLGTSPNPLISQTTKGLEINKRRCIVADEETGLTTRENVYAGGDAVTGAATVILAMGAGKKAAAAIDKKLSE